MAASTSHWSTYAGRDVVPEQELEQLQGSDICVHTKFGERYGGKLVCYDYRSFVVLTDVEFLDAPDSAALVLPHLFILDSAVEKYVIPRLGMKVDADSAERNRAKIALWRMQLKAMGGKPHVQEPPATEPEAQQGEQLAAPAFSLNDFLTRWYVRLEEFVGSLTGPYNRKARRVFRVLACIVVLVAAWFAIRLSVRCGQSAANTVVIWSRRVTSAASANMSTLTGKQSLFSTQTLSNASLERAESPVESDGRATAAEPGPNDSDAHAKKERLEIPECPPELCCALNASSAEVPISTTFAQDPEVATVLLQTVKDLQQCLTRLHDPQHPQQYRVAMSVMLVEQNVVSPEALQQWHDRQKDEAESTCERSVGSSAAI